MAEPALAHYTYRVEWSSRRAQYVARCLEMPSVSDSADTAPEALARAEHAVAGHLAYMHREFGGEPPTPLTEHDYSGTFLVRTSPKLHARLSTEAAEAAVVSPQPFAAMSSSTANIVRVGTPVPPLGV